MKKYIVGVDIGGTNTDAVIIDKSRTVHATCKVPTENPLSSGLSGVIEQLFDKVAVDRSSVDSIVIGTTHATNAIVQRANLCRVGVIRLTGCCPLLLPSAFSWPPDLYDACIAQTICIQGGYECDGRPIGQVDKNNLIDACGTCLKAGAESIALIGTFAPLYQDQEREARQALHDYFGMWLPVTISSDIGTIGIIERENAAILNAALHRCIDTEFSKFLHVCRQLCDAPVFITQNNGTIISLEKACGLPVLTIASGPTNSCRGGSALAACKDAVIVDIGGTTTDVGAVKNGFARRSLTTSTIGGVAINFPMPDVVSIALGGGSIVSCTNNVVIGPVSVGSHIGSKAQSFGGRSLTLIDCALKLGYAQELRPLTTEIELSKADAQRVFDYAKTKIVPLIAKIKGPNKNLPVVLVGGGAALFPEKFFSDVEIVPRYCSVANAYGAACAQIAATVDSVICMDNRDRDIALMTEDVMEQTIKRGAVASTVSVVQKDIIPYSYVPGNKARVIITASGDRF